MKEYSIGVDIGTTGGKVVLFHGTKPAASFRLEYKTHSDASGYAEHDADDWYDCMCKGIKSVIEQAAISPDDILVVGLSSMTPVLLPIGKDGRPLMRAHLWCDTRCSSAIKNMLDVMSRETLLDITGSYIKTGQLLTKLCWLMENHRDICESACAFLMPTGYLTYCLTGELNVDASHGELTLLVDLATGQWSQRICGAYGIDAHKLPPLIPSDSIAGYISREAAQKCGLPAGTPVVSGGHDSALSAYALGITKPYQACLDIGNASNMVMCIPSPLPCLGSDLYRHPINGIWLFQIYSATTGAAFRWLKDNLCELDEREALYNNQNVYDVLCERAEHSPAGAKSLLFTPYFAGAQQGGSVSSTLVGLTLSHNKDDIIRALLEGCAMSIRLNMEQLEAAAGQEMESIALSGGGSKSPIWAQIHADILGRTLITSDIGEGAVTGAAMLARSVVNQIPYIGSAEGRVYQPNLDNKAIYDESYSRFCALLQRQIKEI